MREKSKEKEKSKNLKKIYEPLFFNLPALIIIIIFYILPVILSIYISFTPLKNWNLDKYLGEIIGFKNYERFFHMLQHDPIIRGVFLTTIAFVGLTLVFNVVGGLLLALSTYFITEKVSSPLRTLWLLPRMAPIAVYSLVWYYFSMEVKLAL